MCVLNCLYYILLGYSVYKSNYISAIQGTLVSFKCSIVQVTVQDSCAAVVKSGFVVTEYIVVVVCTCYCYC